MFRKIFDSLFQAMSVSMRVVKSSFIRIFSIFTTRIRRVLNLSAQAAKYIPRMVSAVMVSNKKPTKREDYIETKRLFISKSTLVVACVIVVLLGFGFWYFARPQLISWFFVRNMYYEDKLVNDYNGRVRLYYDEEKKQLMFSGRLEDGKYTLEGELYDEDGLLVYSGTFLEGLYSGKGSQYISGELVYEGDFSEGIRQGTGKEYENGVLVYSGGFSENLRSGQGEEYDVDGNVIFRGIYANGQRNGDGSEYFSSGNILYRGGYIDGLRDGYGTLFDETGEIVYDGYFLKGLYNGSGILYDGELSLTGEFKDGMPSGSMNLYDDGTLKYVGQVSGVKPDGVGKLYNNRGEVIFDGNFDEGFPDGYNIIGLTPTELRTLIVNDTLNETERSTGFYINALQTGLEAFATYRSEDAESEVIYVSVGTRPDTAIIRDAMLASDRVVPITIEIAVSLTVNTEYFNEVESKEGVVKLIWREEPDGDPIFIEWCVLSDEAAEHTVDDSENVEVSAEPEPELESDERLGLLEEYLELQNRGQYCEDYTAYVNYIELTEERTAALRRQELYSRLLEVENEKFRKGQDNADRINELESLLESEANKLEIIALGLQKLSLTGLSFDDETIFELLCFTDIRNESIADLLEAAVAKIEADRASAKAEANTDMIQPDVVTVIDEQIDSFVASAVLLPYEDNATVETSAPETTAPETAVPETTVPETTAPETVAPETAAPETTAPETTAPETTAPETTVPDTTAPETTAPETTTPETTAPETTAPETTTPETTAPETTAPETTAPETTTPETTTITEETTVPEPIDTVALETEIREIIIDASIEYVRFNEAYSKYHLSVADSEAAYQSYRKSEIDLDELYQVYISEAESRYNMFSALCGYNLKLAELYELTTIIDEEAD